jgi:broad specificity phosphatase PhoE
LSVRLDLFCHAATSATRAASFPADEPVDLQGLAKAAALADGIRRVDAAWTSPALRARQTAEALSLVATVEPLLRELDFGQWAGHSMADIGAKDPAGLAAWLGDADAAPHGGESVARLVERIASWLAALDHDAGRVVAVTHASVIRAAVVTTLGAAPEAFWRIDVAPLCRLRLQGDRGRWTLRSIGAATGDR